VIRNLTRPAFEAEAPGLTPRSAIEKFAAVQMIDLHMIVESDHRDRLPCCWASGSQPSASAPQARQKPGLSRLVNWRSTASVTRSAVIEGCMSAK
jgi:hypothetical protein